MTIEQVFLRVISLLDSANIQYMVSGALAVSFFGKPRLTHDLDLVTELEPRHAPTLLSLFSAEFYASPEAIEDAIRRRSVFNVIQVETGFKVDFWLLQETEFDQNRFKRRRNQDFFGHSVPFTTAEDLILIKLFWFGESQIERHLEDARSVLETQMPQIDLPYLRHWAERLSLTPLLERILVSGEPSDEPSEHK